MQQNRPLTLRVAKRRDFAAATRILGLLILLAALLSPQPVLMLILVFLLCGAGWGTHALGFHEINCQKRKLVVFPDGQIRLEFDCKNPAGGFLDGQQWCTHRFALLRIRVGGSICNLPILSSQQQVDDIRRLNMWLRQDFYNGTSEKPVPRV
jgi:hypothetical protein